MNARFAIAPIQEDLAAEAILNTWSPNTSEQKLSTGSLPQTRQSASDHTPEEED